jgi:hypothetical protein
MASMKLSWVVASGVIAASACSENVQPGGPGAGDTGSTAAPSSGGKTSDSAVPSSGGNAPSSGGASGDACVAASCLGDSGSPPARDADSASSDGACPAAPWQDLHTAACGADKCGNGVIDTCTVLCASLGPCPQLTEDCEGTVSSGTTCETLGYTGGQLACTPWCSFDTRNCLDCASPGGPLLSCKRPCIDDDHISLLFVTARDGTIAVAWQTPNELHLAGFDGNLRPLFESTPIPIQSTLIHIAAAASTTGWLVATGDDTAVDLYAFDADGHAIGAPQIMSGASDPALGMRPAGAPLLLWSVLSSDGTMFLRQAALLTDGGQLATSPVTLWQRPEELTGTLFLGDGFLIAQRGDTAVRTARLGLNGMLSSPIQTPLGGSTEAPRLVWVGSHVGVLYFDYNIPASIQWALLDTAGALVSGPTPLSPQPETVDWRFDAVASDTGALLLTRSGQPYRPSALPHLLLSAVDTQGHITGTPYPIASSGQPYAVDQIVSMGTKAVAGWIVGMPGQEGSTVGLATISLSAP